MTLGGIEDESCNKFQTRGTKFRTHGTKARVQRLFLKLEHGGKENKMNNF
jgi:hypothetical protein